DAVARLAPVPGGIIGDSRDQPPIFRGPAPALDQIYDGAISKIPKAVELALAKSVVAEPHRPRATGAGNVIAPTLLGGSTAISPIEQLNRHFGRRTKARDPTQIPLGAVEVAHYRQRCHCQRRVAGPGVAVVVIAVAAEALGQRTRRGSGDSAGRGK